VAPSGPGDYPAACGLPIERRVAWPHNHRNRPQSSPLLNCRDDRPGEGYPPSNQQGRYETSRIQKGGESLKFLVPPSRIEPRSLALPHLFCHRPGAQSVVACTRCTPIPYPSGQRTSSRTIDKTVRPPRHLALPRRTFSIAVHQLPSEPHRRPASPTFVPSPVLPPEHLFASAPTSSQKGLSASVLLSHLVVVVVTRPAPPTRIIGSPALDREVGCNLFVFSPIDRPPHSSSRVIRSLF